MWILLGVAVVERVRMNATLESASFEFSLSAGGHPPRESLSAGGLPSESLSRSRQYEYERLVVSPF